MCKVILVYIKNSPGAVKMDFTKLSINNFHSGKQPTEFLLRGFPVIGTLEAETLRSEARSMIG